MPNSQLLQRNWFFDQVRQLWHLIAKPFSQLGSNYRSSYQILLVAKKTGVDGKTNATQFRLEMYDREHLLFFGSGFSGGDGNRPIRNGNFTINTKVRDAKGPDVINHNSPLNNPPAYFGIQKMHDIQEGNLLYAVVGAYGLIRARLIPWKGTDEGDYFHGQSNGHGYTHGCLCYGTDTRFIDYMWRVPPQKIAVAVNFKVIQP